MQKTVVQVLEEIEELLSNRNRWTQCAAARDAKGLNVTPYQPEACRWCLAGALCKVTGPLGKENSQEVARLRRQIGNIFGEVISGVPGNGSYVDYNDSHDHPYVMRLIARAKEVALAQV